MIDKRQAPSHLYIEVVGRRITVSIHSPHPSIREKGLADHCPRCAELAEYPFGGLDDRNMEDVIDRLSSGELPRSINEDVAMGNVKVAMLKAEVLWRRGWRPAASFTEEGDN